MATKAVKSIKMKTPSFTCLAAILCSVHSRCLWNERWVDGRVHGWMHDWRGALNMTLT